MFRDHRYRRQQRDRFEDRRTICGAGRSEQCRLVHLAHAVSVSEEYEMHLALLGELHEHGAGEGFAAQRLDPHINKVAIVDVLGAAIDDRGVCSTFRQKLDIPREAVPVDHLVNWRQSLRLPPGLYQVRVAVRDRQSGRTGSALTWVEIRKMELAPTVP